MLVNVLAKVKRNISVMQEAKSRLEIKSSRLLKVTKMKSFGKKVAGASTDCQTINNEGYREK